MGSGVVNPDDRGKGPAGAIYRFVRSIPTGVLWLLVGLWSVPPVGLLANPRPPAAAALPPPLRPAPPAAGGLGGGGGPPPPPPRGPPPPPPPGRGGGGP